MPVLKVLLNECSKQRPKLNSIPKPQSPESSGGKTNFEIKTLSGLNRIIRLWLLRNPHGL